MQRIPSDQPLTLTTATTLALDYGGTLAYTPGWLDVQERADLFETLTAQTPWERKTIQLFGRTVAEPRLTAAFADPGVQYLYSGAVGKTHAWPAHVQALRERVQAQTGTTFNYVLLNFYRDGSDSIGDHADDEPELGKNPTIASLSLGATRKFVCTLRGNSKIKHCLNLTDGSLLVMSGTMQRYWLHGVPKTRILTGPRINLTFRNILR